MEDDRVVHPPGMCSVFTTPDRRVYIDLDAALHEPKDAVRLALAIIDEAVRADPTLTGDMDMAFIARMHRRCAVEVEAIAEIVTLAREAFGEGPQEIP